MLSVEEIPSSAAFEAMAAFVAAKVGSGSNVTCNVLLYFTFLPGNDFGSVANLLYVLVREPDHLAEVDLKQEL